MCGGSWAESQARGAFEREDNPEALSLVTRTLAFTVTWIFFVAQGKNAACLTLPRRLFLRSSKEYFPSRSLRCATSRRIDLNGVRRKKCQPAGVSLELNAGVRHGRFDGLPAPGETRSSFASRQGELARGPTRPAYNGRMPSSQNSALTVMHGTRCVRGQRGQRV